MDKINHQLTIALKLLTLFNQPAELHESVLLNGFGGDRPNL